MEDKNIEREARKFWKTFMKESRRIERETGEPPRYTDYDQLDPSKIRGLKFLFKYILDNYNPKKR